MSKIVQEIFSCDAETRNLTLAENLGIYRYNHGHYKLALDSHGLKDNSLQKIIADLGRSEKVNHARECFLQNGLYVTKNDQDVFQADDRYLREIAQELDEKFVTPCVKAFIEATHAPVSHRLIFGVFKDSGKWWNRRSFGAKIGGWVNLERNHNVKQLMIR